MSDELSKSRRSVALSLLLLSFLCLSSQLSFPEKKRLVIRGAVSTHRCCDRGDAMMALLVKLS